MPSELEFVCGCAAYADLFFCVKAQPNASQAIAKGGFPFSFHGFDEQEDEKWVRYTRVFNWPAQAVASFKPGGGDRVVVALGPHGEVYEIQTTDSSESTSVIPGSPRFLGRNLAVANETAFALGMGRCIARWDGPQTWTRIDPDLPADDDKATGFNDLVVASPGEMYTLGWSGEIFRTDGVRWQAVDSPVSAALRAACVGADGLVYAAGYDGTMIRGRGDDWSIIETDRKGVFLDICTLGQDVFVSTAFEVFKLTEGGLVAVSEFADPDDRPRSCTGLSAATDGSCVFWMGGSDLFRFDGALWQRVV
ncbi:WD40/YVTN/BNR-like repeat-containing protein [Piscinibacterium candidicorallinum]|uniref:WD40/YVTN/BNR-like repeat-containing protein n=1 Tax=Piscinibacterium candidicorallinum TaxID=1793872 RepID=A0ABV7H5S0_9BURK